MWLLWELLGLATPVVPWRTEKQPVGIAGRQMEEKNWTWTKMQRPRIWWNLGVMNITCGSGKWPPYLWSWPILFLSRSCPLLSIRFRLHLVCLSVSFCLSVSPSMARDFSEIAIHAYCGGKWPVTYSHKVSKNINIKVCSCDGHEGKAARRY